MSDDLATETRPQPPPVARPTPRGPGPVRPSPAGRVAPRRMSGLAWVCVGLAATTGVLGLVAWLGLVGGSVAVAGVGVVVGGGLVRRRWRRSGRGRLPGSGGVRRPGRVGGLLSRATGGRFGGPRRTGVGGRSPFGGGRSAARPGGLRSRLPRMLGGTRGRSAGGPSGGRAGRPAGRLAGLRSKLPRALGGTRSRGPSTTRGGSAGRPRMFGRAGGGSARARGGSPFRGGRANPRNWGRNRSTGGPRSSGSRSRSRTRTAAAGIAAGLGRLLPGRTRNTTSSPTKGKGKRGLLSRINQGLGREIHMTPTRAGTSGSRPEGSRKATPTQPAPTEPSQPATTSADTRPPDKPEPKGPAMTQPTGNAEEAAEAGTRGGGHSAVEDISVMEFHNRMARRSEAGAAATMAKHLTTLADQTQETQPVSDAIPDAMRAAAKLISEAERILDELPAAIARETAAARERAGNPAKGDHGVERKNDSDQNKDHV